MAATSPGYCRLCERSFHFCYHFENCQGIVVAVCHDCLKRVLRFSVDIVLPSL